MVAEGGGGSCRTVRRHGCYHQAPSLSLNGALQVTPPQQQSQPFVSTSFFRLDR